SGSPGLSGRPNGVINGPGTIRPILPALYSVNQTFPSEPSAMPLGLLLAVGIGNSVISPSLVTRPIWLAGPSVNHRFPSGPAVIQNAPPDAVGVGYSLTDPVVVIRPIPESTFEYSENQRAPSCPPVMAIAPVPA